MRCPDFVHGDRVLPTRVRPDVPLQVELVVESLRAERAEVALSAGHETLHPTELAGQQAPAEEADLGALRERHERALITGGKVKMAGTLEAHEREGMWTAIKSWAVECWV